MHIKINNSNCNTRLEFCEQCISQFINNLKSAQRPCLEIVDNGDTMVTFGRLDSIHKDVTVVESELLSLAAQ
jgi:hypothetical protein